DRAVTREQLKTSILGSHHFTSSDRTRSASTKSYRFLVTTTATTIGCCRGRTSTAPTIAATPTSGRCSTSSPSTGVSGEKTSATLPSLLYFITATKTKRTCSSRRSS